MSKNRANDLQEERRAAETGECGGSSSPQKSENAVAAPPKRSGKKKVVFFLVFFLICAASLAFTAFNDFSGDVLPFSEIIGTIGKNWFYLVFAVVSALLVLVFDWLKTVCLLYGFEKKPRFKLCAETAVITKFYDYITPFGAGGSPSPPI